jgi:small subunit ribosomal protein S11|tara:strand:- start:445 stop:1068 length:624 start_codon:yes stop_codon:yes gene_type:complete
MSEEENKEEIVKPKEATVKPKKTTKAVKPDGEKQQPKVDKEVASEAKKQPEVDKETAPEEKVQKPEKKEESAADLLGANIEQVKIRKAKGSKNITSGICYVVATFNNTKVSFTDMKGNVISWSSSGKCNFRGSRKSTAYAAQVVTQDAGKVAMSHGMKEVLVKVKGPGMGRDSAIRALQSLGFSVSSILDVTPVPHNGCRAPKRRRV